MGMLRAYVQTSGRREGERPKALQADVGGLRKPPADADAGSMPLRPNSYVAGTCRQEQRSSRPNKTTLNPRCAHVLPSFDASSSRVIRSLVICPSAATP